VITTVWVVATDLALEPSHPSYDSEAVRQFYKELLAAAREPIKKIRVVPDHIA
jgi:hypothetical protein